jgi:AcrR family transcriptional regulator
MNRAERRRLDTRERIKEAAYALLIERGYKAVTIRAIADLADIGVGTFYLHFRDKDDVIWTVFSERAVDRDARAIQSLDGVPHGEKEFRGFLLFFGSAQGRLDLLKSVFGGASSGLLYQKYLDLLVTVFIKNADSGALHPGLDDVPTEFLAHYFAGAVLRLLLWWADDPERYTPEEMAALLYETFYRQPAPSLT